MPTTGKGTEQTARRFVAGPSESPFAAATAGLVDELMRERNRKLGDLVTDFLAGCAPDEWGRVMVLHESGDFALGYPGPNGYTRVSASECVGFTVRPVARLGQRELGRWFTLTMMVRQDLITRGAI